MFSIRPMSITDIPSVRALVEKTDGLNFNKWESDAVIARMLTRCPDLSMVALGEDGTTIVGCIFIAEGLMGMVHHLAVAPAARKSGLGTELAKTGLRALYRLPDAARRVYVTVLSTNEGALRFWTKFGFTPQTAEGNIHLFTLDLGAQSWLNT